MIALTLVSSGRGPYRAPDAIALALAAVSGLALAWRQVAPLAATAVTSTVVVVNALAGYSVVAVQWPPWLALFSCFSLGSARARVVGVALCAVGVGGYAVFDRDELAIEAVAGIVMTCLIATVGGDAARSRRAVAAAQHAQIRGEAREQALAAERLLHEERSRLAGELHDALGHTVNVMVLQAGVARRLFAGNPAFARQALVDIESIGREALGELDRMLRVLHPKPDSGQDDLQLDQPGLDDPAPAGLRPVDAAPVDAAPADAAPADAAPADAAPADAASQGGYRAAGGDDCGNVRDPSTGLGGLALLADRIRATGRTVDLDLEPVELSPGVERAVYGIVREALTNAVRHTHAGRIRVAIGLVAGQLRAEVFNEGAGFAAPVPGRGLIGMRERARLEGGSLETGPVEGGFQVLATLPTLPTAPMRRMAPTPRTGPVTSSAGGS